MRARMLGGLSLFVDNEPVSFPTSKVAELAAFLLWNKEKWISRERLRSMLWPEVTDARASANLRQSLYRLRGTLGAAGCDGVLEVRRTDVCVRPNGHDVVVDALDFEGAARAALDSPEGSLSQVISAAAGYTGLFLPTIDSDWAAQERRRLDAVHLALLRQAVTELSRAGLYEAAIPYATRLVAAEPLNEEAHCALMRLHGQSGNPAGALQQFEACRTQLLDELGVEPSPATMELCREIGLKPRDSKKPSRQRRGVPDRFGKDVIGGPLYRAGLLVAMADSQTDTGDSDAALRTLERAQRLYQEADDEEGLARVSLSRASALIGTYTGPRPDLAVPEIEHALSYYRRFGESAIYCRALHTAANVAAVTGDGARLASLSEEGLKLAKRLHNRDYEIRIETMMSVMDFATCRLTSAGERLERVSGLVPYSADPSATITFMIYYAELALLTGDMKVSAQRHEELLAVLGTLPPGMERASGEIPARMLAMTTYYFMGKQARVRQLNPLPDYEAYLPEHALHASRLLMRPRDSRAACLAAAELIKAHMPEIIPEQVPLFTRQLCEAMLEFDLPADALEWADIGIAAGAEAGSPPFSAIFEAYRAHALHLLGDDTAAEKSLSTALNDRDPADEWTLVNALWVEALLAQDRADQPAADLAFADALALCDRLGMGLHARQIRQSMQEAATADG